MPEKKLDPKIGSCEPASRGGSVLGVTTRFQRKHHKDVERLPWIFLKQKRFNQNSVTGIKFYTIDTAID